MKTERRTIHPEVRVIDSKKGIVEYVASDETLDSYREVIRAGGWRFTHFKKNAPFVDSHDYWTIEKCVGRVIDFNVVGKQLVETVQWAIDVAENKLAQIGFKMTAAGYLKAVSVGFWPTKYLSKWDKDPRDYFNMLIELGYNEENGPRVIYLEQEQVELSACIIGANPNALAKQIGIWAKACKAGVVSDEDIESISLEQTERETARATDDPAEVARAKQRAREEFLAKLNNAIKQS
jgi:hypothetical protein